MASKLARSLQRVAARFLRAPFENLPPEYGDPVPPELRVFEAEAEEARREPAEEIAVAEMHHQRSQPARQDKSMPRQ